MKKVAVAVKNIVKDFEVGNGKQRVLFDISTEIYAGELTMLVGPSGCGKTTLISIISGILSETSGEIIINNTSITKLSDNEKVDFRRKNIGFIFQQYNLLPSLTAAENASVALVADGVEFSAACKKSAEILKKIDMGDNLEKTPSQLSGGQQQRVAIARALVHEPKLIICDEPTAALDAATGHKVMEILKQIALEGDRAVIVVTHDNRIFDFADRIINMEDGKIIKEQ